MTAGESKQAIHEDVLVRQYSAAITMLSQSNTRRTATARF